MPNATLEQRKARIAELGGWKALFQQSLIASLRDLGEVIVPVVFNRTVFLAFLMCVGVTWRYQAGDVSAENGGMVIAFTLLWLMSDLLLHPFFLSFGSIRWDLIVNTADLTPEQKASRTASRASLITGLFALAGLGIWARINLLTLVIPVLVLAAVCFACLFGLRALTLVSNHFLDDKTAA